MEYNAFDFLKGMSPQKVTNNWGFVFNNWVMLQVYFV